MVIISISGPHTEEEGTRQRFTSYLIETERGNSVRRRFSDFVWLQSRLQTEFPGAVVPTLPHSRALTASKKFDPDFIERRRRDLQQFLQDVVDHEELARAPSMSPFMTDVLGNDFEEGKKKVEARTPTNLLYTNSAEEDYGLSDPDSEKSSGGPQRSAKKGISNFFAKIRVSAGSKELMATDNENEVVALHEYINEVAGYVKTLVKVSDNLVRETANMSATFDTIGVPIGEWRTAYQQQKDSLESNGATLEVMSTLVEFSTDFSTLMRKKHIEEEETFAFQIHRLNNTILSFQKALKQRRSIQVQYTATNKQIIDKDNALAKANKNLKPPDVTDKLRDERMDLEQRSDLEKKVLEECTQRLLRDAQKYKPLLMTMLKEAFLKYSQIQLSYTDRVNRAFGQLLSYLDDTNSVGDGGDDSTPLGTPMASPPATAPEEVDAAKNQDSSGDDDIVVEDLDGSSTSMQSSGESPKKVQIHQV